MAYLRFEISGAVKMPLPQALQDALPTIKTKINQLKAYCEKINAGQPNEENTVRFKHHICRHDEGKPCDQEEDI